MAYGAPGAGRVGVLVDVGIGRGLFINAEAVVGVVLVETEVMLELGEGGTDGG